MVDHVKQSDTVQQPRMATFWTIWIGQVFSLLGSSLVQFALIWHLTRQTGSATVLAAATLMGMLPQVVISPFAGALVDRWNRRRVMIAADSGIALATVALGLLFALGVAQIWHIYLLLFVRSVGGSFHFPAMQASTTMLVPERHLSRIAGLNQGLYGLMNIVSAPLGALLLGLLPMQGILAIDVATAIIAAGTLLFVSIPQPARSAEGDSAGQKSLLADVREGLRFVWNWPGMLVIVLVAMLINLVTTPAFSLLPLLVTDYLNGGAFQLAWLETAFGIGVVAGGLLLGIWGGFRRRVATAMLALVVMGTATVTLGLSPAVGLALAIGAFAAAGIAQPVANGSLFAVLQSVVPPEMQGRVFTIVASGAGAMAPLGLAVAGPVADAAGVPPIYIAAGIVILVMGALCLMLPVVMNVEADGEARFGRREAADTAAPVEVAPAAAEAPAR